MQQNLSSTTAGNKTKYKIVLLGDCGVGKSSIIEKYIHGKFDESMQSTVGIDFLAKNVQHRSKTYRLQLWDTAGQQRFKSLIPSYLKEACCAIIVFDVTRKMSLVNASKWLRLFSQYKNLEGYSILVANKTDLNWKQTTRQQVEATAKELNLGFFQVSAKSGIGIQRLFLHIIQQLETGVVNGIPMGTVLDQVVEQQDQRDEQSKQDNKPKVQSVEQTETKIFQNTTPVQPNIVLNSRETNQQPMVARRSCCQ